MKRFLGFVFCGALMLTASSASAEYYYISNGTYFIAGNMDTPPLRRVNVQSAEVAFFTPVAGYQRAGYQCVPLIEVSKVNGQMLRKQGTACRSLNAR
jgi:hypothetical protein